MKRAPPPVHNALQAYVRLVLNQPNTPTTTRRLLCTACHTYIRDTSKRRHGPVLNSQPQWRANTSNSKSVHLSRRRQGHLLQQRRCMATVHDVPDRASYGPLKEYEERIHARKLREDEHQRSTQLSPKDLPIMLTMCSHYRTFTRLIRDFVRVQSSSSTATEYRISRTSEEIFVR